MNTEERGHNQPYLKAKNIWWLRLFSVANVAAFLAVAIGHQLSTTLVNDFWNRLSLKDGLLALCFPLATIILNGLVGDLGKARLVFWRWTNPLPGCRAFSVVAFDDPRVDVPRLRGRLKQFPSEPKEQNALWYRLYKAHSRAPTISEAHRLYLLTRDLATLAAIFAVAFSIGASISGASWKLAIIYSGLLLAQYLIIATSARNYGTRFVANVLTEESHAQT